MGNSVHDISVPQHRHCQYEENVNLIRIFTLFSQSSLGRNIQPRLRRIKGKPSTGRICGSKLRVGRRNPNHVLQRTRNERFVIKYTVGRPLGRDILYSIFDMFRRPLD